MNYKEDIRSSMMCRELKKQNLTLKKRLYAVARLPLKECKFICVNIGRKRKILTLTTLKAFLRQFSLTTTKMVDVLLATALEGVNTKHFKNWFTSCCYCTL